jgi:hypothetical protein
MEFDIKVQNFKLGGHFNNKGLLGLFMVPLRD